MQVGADKCRFICSYLIVLCVAIIIALVLMSPRLAKRMALTAPVHEHNLAIDRHTNMPSNPIPQRDHSLAGAYA